MGNLGVHSLRPIIEILPFLEDGFCLAVVDYVVGAWVDQFKFSSTSVFTVCVNDRGCFGGEFLPKFSCYPGDLPIVDLIYGSPGIKIISKVQEVTNWEFLKFPSGIVSTEGDG